MRISKLTIRAYQCPRSKSIEMRPFRAQERLGAVVSAHGYSSQDYVVMNGVRSVSVGSGPDGDHLVYVADMHKHRIQVFKKEDGTFVRTIGTTGQSGSGNDRFNDPCGVHVDGHMVYVADTGNRRIQVLKNDGTFVRTVDREFAAPRSVCVDSGPDGSRLYVTDTFNNQVLVLKEDDTLVHAYGAGDDDDSDDDESGEWWSGIDQLHEPSGVAVESRPDGFVYVADKHNGRVVVFLKQY